ncbi:MAG: hypothetical protein K2G69_00730 [Muribaculaceae bacterium]|nr:hypothetical protein [Muribaculaceae bacterium]
MNFAEIKKLVIEEYDDRHLAQKNRYRALENFDDFLKRKDPSFWNDVSKFPENKELMKLAYCKFLEKDNLNGAESSMINEVYNQINLQEIKLTDYSKKD